jgi:DNA-binding MarR family transcriptional regulator
MTTKEDTPQIVQDLAANFLRIFKLATKPELPNELRHRQFHFLLTLVKLMGPDGVGVKPSNMSDTMHVTRGAITHILNHMEENNLIERIADPTDRRNVLVKPTAEGMRVLDESYQAVLKRLSGLVDYLGEDDVRELNRILSKSIPYLKQQAEKNQPACSSKPWRFSE